MADDWDVVTKIGSKARGGASQRETVVRGNAALNAAHRSGTIIGTEKKMGAGNSASKPGVEGQHLTKVDRSDEIVPLKKPDPDVGKAIAKARQAMVPKVTQKDLAKKCNAQSSDIAAFENAQAIPDNKMMTTMEKVLKVHLRGSDFGKPITPKVKAEVKKSGK